MFEASLACFHRIPLDSIPRVLEENRQQAMDFFEQYGRFTGGGRIVEINEQQVTAEAIRHNEAEKAGRELMDKYITLFCLRVPDELGGNPYLGEDAPIIIDRTLESMRDALKENNELIMVTNNRLPGHLRQLHRAVRFNADGQLLRR